MRHAEAVSCYPRPVPIPLMLVQGVEKRLSILVAAYSGNLSGVETYAEQVARAGAQAAQDITLLAIGPHAAAKLRERISSPVRILATEPLRQSAWRTAARQLPTLALNEMLQRIDETLSRLDQRFDVAHLNHPALAGAARPYARRVVAAAWFYPHGPRERVVETWRHTGGAFPKSAGLALKGLFHYWNDRKGFSACDWVVAPTELLAAQLRQIGISATVCSPPASLSEATGAGDRRRSLPAPARQLVTIVCGDLSHPRKNVAAGVDAVRILASAGMKIDLELIGRNAGAFEAELRRVAPSVRVLAPGPLPHAEVLARLQRTDVLLVPSLYEEWGYVATEALLSGTPVVAFPVYPFVEILTRPLGRCADDMSSRTLSQALSQILAGEATPSLVASTAESRFGADAIGQRLTMIWSRDAADDRKPALSGVKT